MGYHGILSKGCQRCRRRKVKCDQNKPACARCERLGVACPGYRDLTEAQFIDESSRVVQKATARAEPPSKRGAISDKARTLAVPERSCTSLVAEESPMLGQYQVEFPFFPNSKAGLQHPVLGSPMNALSINFFLAHYAPTGPILADQSYDWLFQAYRNPTSDLVRLATDAVSLSALANKFFAPDLIQRSKHLYSESLVRLNKTLQDPIEAVRDDTLMAVILLGLYERVNLKNWDDYRRWSAHIEGATTLLELRGAEQFSRAAGKQLYVHLRSQIIHNCIVQHIPVPESLKDASSHFRPWKHTPITYDTRPGSLARVSFDVVNLRAAVDAGTITEATRILQAALEAESTLIQWTAHAPRGWSHDLATLVTTTATTATAQLNEHAGTTRLQENAVAHTYANVNVAQVWNNWRVLRIITHQILLQHALPRLCLATKTLGALDDDDDDENNNNDLVKQGYSSAHIIQQMSLDVLAAAPSITNTPRIGSLVWPLFVIAQEPLNPSHVRSQAVRYLREINDILGYRIASLMADTAEETFDNGGA